MSFPERFHTGEGGERITQIRVTGKDKLKNKVEPYEKKVIFSVKLTNIKIGDVISIKSVGELTNDRGYNVMLAYYTALGSTATDATGLELTEPKGFNITKDMHHGVFIDTDDYIFEADYATVYINTIVYAASSAALYGMGGKQILKVEADYGRLSVLLWRKP